MFALPKIRKETIYSFISLLILTPENQNSRLTFGGSVEFSYSKTNSLNTASWNKRLFKSTNSIHLVERFF